jgi:hypothetical protein
MRMINLVWSGLLTLLLLSGCGFDGTATRSVTDFLPLVSIEITAESPTIAQGTSTALKVNGFHQSGGLVEQFNLHSRFHTYCKPNKGERHSPGNRHPDCDRGGRVGDLHIDG